MSEEKSPAVKAAKNVAKRKEDTVITLASGVTVKLVPVSASLIDEVTSMVEEPQVPLWHNPDKDRDEPNYADPNYIKAVDDANRKRGVAGMDAMIMFGVELVDGLPEDESWLKKLKIMEKRGQVSLDVYDMDDEIDMEFLYKRYIAVDASVLDKITKISGISQEAVEEAEASFQGN